MPLNRKPEVAITQLLTRRFIEQNNGNACDTFNKWEWDAIIHGIETKEFDEKFLIEKNFITA